MIIAGTHRRQVSDRCDKPGQTTRGTRAMAWCPARSAVRGRTGAQVAGLFAPAVAAPRGAARELGARPHRRPILTAYHYGV